MRAFNFLREISGEIPTAYHKKDTKQRELTAQELELLNSQKTQLDQLVNIAQEQFDISKEDRETYEKVFRDADTPEAQEKIKDLQEIMTGTRPSGQVTTDMLLRDVLIGSTGEMKKATEQFVTQQAETFDKYKGELGGLSTEYVDTIKSANEQYQTELQTAKEQMGTIDTDILSRETGAATAGISSAFAEARKQTEADLARRGLAGSGAEVSALSQMYQQEALAQGGAIAQARASALGISDERRMQQMGIAGQQAQFGQQAAGTAYGVQAGVAGQLYGQQAQLQQQGYGLTASSFQQGISNLQALNAASQGIYVGAGNYLGQSASSFGQAASQYGAASVAQGQMQLDYAKQQAEKDAAIGEGIGSLAGMAMMSDERLKTNIEFQKVENGHNIYTWDWIEGHDYGYNEGVLAQEVLETNPDAVVMMDNGYLAVNYSKLGV